MKGKALALAALLLAGCAPSPQQQAYYDAKERLWHLRQALHDARRAMERCAPGTRSDVRTYVESAACSNARVLAVWQDADYPYMDLLHLVAEARLAGARRVDAGAISADQYQAQLADLARRVALEAALREVEANPKHGAAAPPPNAFAEARAIRRRALLNGLPAFEELARNTVVDRASAR
jgi:hypothetical protein